MFLHLSVCSQGRGSAQCPLDADTFPLDADTTPPHPQKYDQQAGGTHPIGMHTGPLLAMVALTAVQSSARTFAHNAIWIIETSNNA